MKHEIIEGLTEGEYDQIQATRSSHIKTLMKLTPEHLKQEMDKGSTDSPAKFKGSASHVAILEPETFKKRIVKSPYSDYRSNEAKAWRDEQVAAGKIALKDGVFQEVIDISTAVHRNPVARELLTGKGMNELTLVWEDQESGVTCKARLDRMTSYTAPDGQGGMQEVAACPDVKTIGFPADLHRIRNQAAEFGWAIQSAFYRRGVEAHHGQGQPRLYPFIIVEAKPPHCTRVFELAWEDIERANTVIDRELARIAKCKRENNWPGWPATMGLLNTPLWAFPPDDEVQL